MKLLALLTLHVWDLGVSHSFYSLCRPRPDRELDIRMVVPSCEPACRQPNLVEAIPKPLRKLYYRSRRLPIWATERRFRRELKSFDAAYLWPGVSMKTAQRVRSMGKPIVLERVNCFTGVAKDILDQAYMKAGIAPQHSITDALIQEELAILEAADFVFCPSPQVQQSFRAAGVPDRKLLLTSYGWSPNRFPYRRSLQSTPVHSEINSDADSADSKEITILFVGAVCIRKGAHKLMQAFVRSGIRGKLVLRGVMEPALAELCRDWLQRSDIVHIPYTPDMSSAYSDADIFAFPSYEEAGPMVTYEAMAHGVPVVVSPMGAGSIARSGQDGFVLPPDDEDAWVETLRSLATDAELRRRLGEAAQQRASEFTWEKVAARRESMLNDRLRPKPVYA